MINRAVLDQVEEAIDCFEENWSPDSRGEIDALLDAYDLTNDQSALTELIRIDIELRYKHAIPVSLNDYFKEFDALLEIPECASQIAFEDFRSRRTRGHEVTVSRWEHLPGIRKELWFQELLSEHPATSVVTQIANPNSSHDPDVAFQTAIQTAGFRLIHEIGKGSFSHVYLATQRELADRYVVLKVVDRALAEPQCMAMLQHTNIVPIYSFHRILSRSVICMPYAGSLTLEDFLKEKAGSDARSGESLVMTVRNRVDDATVACTDDELGPQLDPGTAKPVSLIPAADENAVLKPLEQLRSLGCNELATWIFARLAGALAHSHARGVLHGDLKPGNVLIRNDGEPALLDFNLSQSLDRKTAQHVGGTLPYMAPESYRGLMGQSVSPQSATDIYGLGVMLFEFVTGRLPYPAPRSTAPIDLQPAIDNRQQDPEWHDEDAVSQSLRAIINRCLAYVPENRYSTSEQLQQDLECERQSLSLMHVTEPRRIRFQKWARRHPRVTSGGSVGLMLLMLLVPIGWSAAAWRSRSLNLAAEKSFDAFAKESAEVLSAIMVDPRRHEGAGVEPAIESLERYGVLDGSGLQQFESRQMSDEQRRSQRDTLLRHVAQVAFTETDRLRPASIEAPLTSKQLQTFDRLLAAADRIRGDYDSRACAFLRAARARMTADNETFQALQAEASRIAFDSDSESYLEAVRLMTERQWSDALELLTVLADRDSIPSGLRWTMMGRNQYNAGQYEEAKLSITQSIEHSPRASRLWYMRGLCYHRLRKYARAESDFDRTLELEPTFVPAWLNRGICRLMLNEMEDGISDLTQGLELSPGHAQILINRSDAYRKLGRTQEAERDLKEAIRSDNVSPASLYSRGKLLMDVDPEQAVADFQQSFLLDPDRVSALTHAARTLSTRLHKPEQAIEMLGRAIELDPDNETATIDRSVLLAHLARAEEALRDTKQALKPPNHDRTLYQAACTNALLNRPRRALTLLAQAIQAGYKADRAAADPDLESIRDMDDFQTIMRAYFLGNPNRPQQRPAPGR
jgi:serine/threonine protein kinase/Flp pilus assembly protein TadD